MSDTESEPRKWVADSSAEQEVLLESMSSRGMEFVVIARHPQADSCCYPHLLARCYCCLVAESAEER